VFVSWHPPWSFADRARWAIARPFLAGFWGGLWGGFWFGAVVAVISGVELGVLVGVAVWVIGWPMMGLAIKHRWGLRPDVEVATGFSLHQLMAQVSDRWLSFGMWFFGFSAVVLTLDLATGMDQVTGFGGFLGGFLPLALDILFVWAIWSERRRRSKP
jgi:hypothetical protein